MAAGDLFTEECACKFSKHRDAFLKSVVEVPSPAGPEGSGEARRHFGKIDQSRVVNPPNSVARNPAGPNFFAVFSVWHDL